VLTRIVDDDSLLATAYTNHDITYLRPTGRRPIGGEFFRGVHPFPLFRLAYEDEHWHVRPGNVDCWLQQLNSDTGPLTVVCGPVRGESLIDVLCPSLTSIRLETSHFKYVLHQPDQSTASGT
jgi:hypothetical protein